MDELLVGYLLEALDPQQQQAVAAQLRAEPALRLRLDALRRTLEPLALDADCPEPPCGLVTATLATIAEHRCRALPQAPIVTPGQRSGGGQWRGLRRADVLVAACLLVLVGGLLLVGVVRAWHGYANRAACANNLRELSAGLERYADNHNGHYPEVEPDGPRSVAGIFVPILYGSGALTARPPVACPGEGRPYLAPASLDDLKELHQNQPDAYRAAVENLAGSYAYCMGYLQGNGDLRGLDRNADNHLPILGDRPPAGGEGNSLNHDGAGQNVLYIGGNVSWCTLRTVGVNSDDIYLNRRSEVRAGVCLEDTVLGPSDASPLPLAP
jgi:hypothetical protein